MQEKDSRLHDVIAKGNIDEVVAAIANGANVNSSTTYMKTAPLHIAAWNGYYEIGKLLLQNGASVHSNDDKNYTPLHFAAMYGRSLQLVQLLLQNGASVHSNDDKNYTPLHLACNHGHKAIAKLLIQCKSDVNNTNSKNFTPLHGAASNEYYEVVTLLLQNGANIDSINNVGQTPLDLAMQRVSNDKIIKLLTQAQAIGKLVDDDPTLDINSLTTTPIDKGDVFTLYIYFNNKWRSAHEDGAPHCTAKLKTLQAKIASLSVSTINPLYEVFELFTRHVECRFTEDSNVPKLQFLAAKAFTKGHDDIEGLKKAAELPGRLCSIIDAALIRDIAQSAISFDESDVLSIGNPVVETFEQ